MNNIIPANQSNQQGIRPNPVNQPGNPGTGIVINTPVASTTKKRSLAETYTPLPPLKHPRIDNKTVDCKTTTLIDNEKNTKIVDLEKFISSIRDCVKKGNYSMAILTAQHALSLDLNDIPLYYTLYYYLCCAYRNFNNSNFAIDTAKECIKKISENLNTLLLKDKNLIAEIQTKLFYSLCVLYFNRNMLSTAEFYALQGLGIANTTNHTKVQLIATLACVYIDQKKYAEAQTITEQGLLIPNIANREKITLYCHLAPALMGLLQYKEVLNIIKEALQIPEIGSQEKLKLLEYFYQATKKDEELNQYNKQFYYDQASKEINQQKFGLVADILSLELVGSEKDKANIIQELSEQGNVGQLLGDLSVALETSTYKEASNAVWEAVYTLKKYENRLNQNK